VRRTAGVTHVTLFTRPDVCGGNCLYCPSVPSVPKSYLPHSYVGRHGLSYDAREQLRYWLADNRRCGGVGEKLEILILGGSFVAHPEEYQREFLRGIYLAVESERRDDSRSLEELVAAHETSSSRRIVGITVEARPNQITDEVVRRLFAAGVTKIEMGVQSLDDDVLDFVERGHRSDAVARATAAVRRNGLKTGYHLLFGMPGSTPESDLASAARALEEPCFRPDHLKIYFCEMFRRDFMRKRLVELYDSGTWKPMSIDRRFALLGEMIPRVPSTIRISRIGRKIAGDELESAAGAVGAAADSRIPRGDVERRFGCRCVRCREPRVRRETLLEASEIVAARLDHEELHLEARPRGRLTCYGLLRMRVAGSEAIVRELHVYGTEAAPGNAGIHQHRGVGRRLMAEAERVARENGLRSLGVASGVGVRRYYERLGFRLRPDALMAKELQSL
jgi:elongator complex protein 3